MVFSNNTKIQTWYKLWYKEKRFSYLSCKVWTYFCKNFTMYLVCLFISFGTKSSKFMFAFEFLLGLVYSAWAFISVQRSPSWQLFTYTEFHSAKSFQVMRNFFWSVFSCISTWKNSVFGHFSHSGLFSESAQLFMLSIF